MTVHARAVQRPALEFALLPRPGDQTPGNAAPMYLLAASQVEQIEPRGIDAQELARKGLPAAETTELQDYYCNEVPLDKLPVADVELLLSTYSTAFQTLDAATKRDHCDWNLPIRELGFKTSLSHLNGARSLANAAATLRKNASRPPRLSGGDRFSSRRLPTWPQPVERWAAHSGAGRDGRRRGRREARAGARATAGCAEPLLAAGRAAAAICGHA